jgi:hypothetical protein
MTPMRASIVGQGSGLPLRLPLCGLMLGFRKLGDVAAGILERDELAGCEAAGWARRTVISSVGFFTEFVPRREAETCPARARRAVSE